MKTHNVHKIKTANMVAVIYIVCCFILTYLLLFIEVPKGNKDLVNFLAGILFSNGIGGIMYFLYNYRKNETNQDYHNNNNCHYCGKQLNQNQEP